MHHRAGTTPDVDQAIEAVVHRDVRIYQALEHVDHARVGLGRCRIGGGRALVVAPGEIDGQASALDGHGGREPNGLRGDAVPVHQHVRRESAVGKLCERSPGAPLRVLQQLVQIARERGSAMLRDERLDPLSAQAVRRCLRPEVARDLACATEVRSDHREEVAVDPAAANSPRRNAPCPSAHWPATRRAESCCCSASRTTRRRRRNIATACSRISSKVMTYELPAWGSLADTREGSVRASSAIETTAAQILCDLTGMRSRATAGGEVGGVITPRIELVAGSFILPQRQKDFPG
jgi:hypothetical protein